MLALLSSATLKVFAIASTGEGLVSGGADGYVKVRLTLLEPMYGTVEAVETTPLCWLSRAGRPL